MAIDQKHLLAALKKMYAIRHFETRAEGAYLSGKIGGFFHSYIGQEAIQTAAVDAIGVDNWWVTTYRCHALALLLGATPNELMCELLGRVNGNALGRGGSMHFFTDNLLGGFGIVGAHIPTATGAAFALKYQEQKNKIAVCFLGDGAVAQGAFHESLNLASLWDLPCLYVIENNEWGMGTHVERALCMKKIAEEIAPSYRMKGISVDGMDYIACYQTFSSLFEEIKRDSRPILVEAKTTRFKGHSISDPGLYRTKNALEACKKRDPIHLLESLLEETYAMNKEKLQEIEKTIKQEMIEALKFAENSPFPDPTQLEEEVFAS